MQDMRREEVGSSQPWGRGRSCPGVPKLWHTQAWLWCRTV